MTELTKFRDYINPKKVLLLLVFWQFFSVLMITVFNWPADLIWLNLVLASIFIVSSKIFDSLLLLVLLIPFYAVLPNERFETLSLWRPLFGLLFMVFLTKDLRFKIKDLRFFSWDRILGYFVLVALIITLIFGKFTLHGLKQLLFFANVYFFYIVLINVVKNREQIFTLLKTAAISLGVIVFFGFAQLIAALFLDLEVFWVYWAQNISRIFYGDGFSQVSLYSNSWFSYTNGRELRMFSILPDSQSFAYLCVFAIGLGLPLVLLASKKIRAWLWTALPLASLGLALSGTRAVWVGMLAPFFMALGLYLKNFHRFFSRKILWVFVIIMLLFALSPIINLGFSKIRNFGLPESLLDRAKSVYRLNEASNAGRLLIWKESLAYFSRQPLGIGLDNFVVTLNSDSNFLKASEEINKRYNLPQKYVTAHSLYLQILVELGVIGFLIFIWFWVEAGKNIYKFLKLHRGSKDALVFVVFCAAMIFLWLLAAAVFDVTWFNDRVLMYFFLTLGITGIIIKSYDEIKD